MVAIDVESGRICALGARPTSGLNERGAHEGHEHSDHQQRERRIQIGADGKLQLMTAHEAEEEVGRDDEFDGDGGEQRHREQHGEVARTTATSNSPVMAADWVT